MYPKPPEHLWLPLVIPEYPTASQLARSVAERGAPVQGGHGEHKAAGRKMGNLGIHASLCGKGHL